MKKSEEYSKPREDEFYVKMMAESLKKIPKKPVSTIQAASTQKLLSMSDEEHAAYSTREIDLSKAIIPASEWVERKIDPYEFNLYEGMRRGSKNTLGQSDKSATTEERKNKAIDAFVFTPPAPLSEVDIDKLTKLDAIKELDILPKEEPKKKSFWDLFARLFANIPEEPQSFYDKLSDEEKEQWQSVAGKEKK